MPVRKTTTATTTTAATATAATTTAATTTAATTESKIVIISSTDHPAFEGQTENEICQSSKCCRKMKTALTVLKDGQSQLQVLLKLGANNSSIQRFLGLFLRRHMITRKV